VSQLKSEILVEVKIYFGMTYIYIYVSVMISLSAGVFFPGFERGLLASFSECFLYSY